MRRPRRRTLLIFLLLVLLLPFVCIALLPNLLATVWVRHAIEREIHSLTGRKVTLGNPISLTLGASPLLGVRGFTLQNPEIFGESNTFEIGAIEIAAPLLSNIRGQYQIDKIVLTDTNLFFSALKDGVSNWSFGSRPPAQQKPKEAQVITIPEVDELTLKNVTLHLLGDGPYKKLRFELCSVKATDGPQNYSAECRIFVDDTPLNLKASLAGLVRYLNHGDADFSLALLHAGTELRLNGRLLEGGGMAVDIDFTGPNLQELSPLLKSELPSLKDYVLHTKAEISPNFDSFKFSDFKVAVGQNDFAGSMQINVSPLDVTADLSSSRVSMPEIMQMLRLDAEKVTPNDVSRTVADQALLPSFEGILANLRLRINHLEPMPGLQLLDFDSDASIADSLLTINSLSTQAFGGHVKVSGKLSSQTSELSLNAKGLEFAALLQPTPPSTQAALKGKIDLKADLRSQGESLNTLKQNLAGTLHAQSEAAKIHSGMLNLASSGLFKILKPIWGDSKEAEIECLVLNLELKNGITKAREQVIKVGDAFIFADGSLNLPRNSIEYHFHVSSKIPSIVSLVPPFQAVGSLASPTFLPSISGTVASAFDTAEGVTRSALGVLGGAVDLMTGKHLETLSGVNLCQEAYRADQNLISAKFGRAMK